MTAEKNSSTLPRGDDPLARLASRHCDGVLTLADCDQLGSLLRSDPQARQFFMAYLDQHAQLLWRYRESAARLAGDADGLVPAESSTEPSGSPVLGFLGAAWQSINTSSRILGLALGGLLVGYFVVVFALVPLARWAAQGHSLEQSAKRVEALPAAPAAPVGSMAEETNSRWSKQPAGPTVRLGLRYALAAGQVESRLARGTRLVFEGPAEWQFDSDQQLQLYGGRVVAQVPHAAVGFTVNTPTASIVDLGTEFAVEVDGAATTSVSVMYGTVELSQREPTAEKARRQERSLRVTAGQGVKISRDRSGAVTSQVADVDTDWARQALAKPAESWIPGALVGWARLAAGQRIAAFQTDAQAAGNQGTFPGGLGLIFRVERPIRVYSLGVFDHLGDGLSEESKLTVQLWSLETGQFKNPDYNGAGQVIAERAFNFDSAGVLLGGYRYQDLDQPLELQVGKYAVVAYGFSERDPNFNDFCKIEVDPHLRLESCGRILSIVESRFTFASPGTFPETFQKDSLSFGAGSFEYAPLEPQAGAKSRQ